MTGYDWQWNSTQQTITLGRNVVVTFASGSAATNAAAGAAPQPLIILSDKLVIDQKPDQQPGKNKFTFTGNVSITDQASKTDPQGEFHTTGDSLVVLAARASARAGATAAPSANADKSSAPVASLAVGPIDSITASGNVVSTQGAIQARGGLANIVPSENQVVLSDSPQIDIALAENTTDTTSQAVIEGGRITWLRDVEEINVAPVPGTASAPGLVKVTLPSNSAPPPGETSAHLVIDGESLRMQYNPEKERRFDIEQTVEVKDPRYTIQSQHLDAEFDPPPAANTTAPQPATGAANLSTGDLLTGAKPVPRRGKLNHIGISGGVTLYQTNLKATTPTAEILPADNLIALDGGAHVEDTLSNVTMDATTIKLAMDGSQASVLGSDGKPALLLLPTLPLGENATQNIATSIASNSVEMERGAEYSNFTFTGNVEVSASSLRMSSGQLDAFTYNVPTAQESDPTKRVRIAQLVARDHVSITQPGFTALAATAEVNPQAGLAQNADANTTTGGGKQFRLVQLKGDPQGLLGPKQPEVDVPIRNMNLSSTTGNTSAPASEATAKILSDDQWLFTSPTANTYVFMGNVSIEVRDANGKIFLATCDDMQVNCSSTATPGGADATAAIPHLVVDNIVAEKNVRIVQGAQDERVSTADRALITPSLGTAKLTGNVVVVNNLTGSSLRYGDVVLTLASGHLNEEVVPQQAAPGQPIQRPTIIVPAQSLHLDEYKKSLKKDSNSATP